MLQGQRTVRVNQWQSFKKTAFTNNKELKIDIKKNITHNGIKPHEILGINLPKHA